MTNGMIMYECIKDYFPHFMVGNSYIYVPHLKTISTEQPLKVMEVDEDFLNKHFRDMSKQIKDIPVISGKEIKAESAQHKGLRFNSGKKRYDLVHQWAHEQMVNVLTKGAEKYEERNWERGMAWSNVLASLERHLAAIKKGEDYDPETGELHAAHIACNAHFLTAYYKIYPQGDDRPHQYLNPPKIGLDIDEVLCDWVGDWTDTYGIKDRPSSWYFDRELVERFNTMRKEGKLDEFYLGLKPLIKPEDLPFEPYCYITSRPVPTEVTEKWLDMHGFPTKPVFTTTKDCTKATIAKQQGLDIFVDDGFHNFLELNNAGICCFLMDAPHNQRYDVGFKRIKSLKEIM